MLITHLERGVYLSRTTHLPRYISQNLQPRLETFHARVGAIVAAASLIGMGALTLLWEGAKWLLSHGFKGIGN